MRALLLAYSDPDVHASSRTRIFQLIPELERAGVRCTALWLYDRKAIGARWYRPGILPTLPFTAKQLAKAIIAAAENDVTLIHQVLLPLPFHEALWRAARRVIYSFTDIPTAKPSNPDQVWSDLERRFRRTISEARYVLVENPANVEWVKTYNNNVVTIVGPIDTDRYYPRPQRHNKQPVVIGWVGSPSTSPYLNILEEPLVRIRERFPQVEIDLVGASPGTLRRVGARVRPWSLETEMSHLHHFDIGVMPLPDNRWTRAKGGYKLLQYMALGIPSVASPVGINQDIIREGENGFLARSSEDWMWALERLIEDKELRVRLGARGREIAEERFSVRAATRMLVSLMKRAAAA